MMGLCFMDLLRLVVNKDVADFAIQNKAQVIKGLRCYRKALFDAVQSVGRNPFFVNQVVFSNIESTVCL